MLGDGQQLLEQLPVLAEVGGGWGTERIPNN